MIEKEERCALGLLLDFEYLLAELYTRAGSGQGLSSYQRGPNAGEVTGGRKVKFDNPIVKAFVGEAELSTSFHIATLRRFMSEVGERPYRASPIDLDQSFTAMAKGAGILRSEGYLDVFADEINFLLGAFMLEDVGLTACTYSLQAAGIKWSRDILIGLHGSLASRAAIVRAFVYSADLSRQSNAIAIYRQKICGLYGTVFQNDDHGVGNRHTASMMPVDGRALAWGRTIEHCAAILIGANREERGGFFPVGICAMLAPDPEHRALKPLHFSELVQEGQMRVVAAFDSERVQLPPMNLDPERFDIRENTPHQPWTETGYTSWAPSCVEISDALVHGAVGIVGVGRHAISETLWHTEPRRHRYDIVAGCVHLDVGIVEPLEGTTVSVLVGAAESYWHTLIDSVARLSLVADAVWPTVRRVLYPSTGVRIAELLELFALPEAVEQREVRSYETFQVRDLIHPSSVHGLFDYHPSLLKAVYARLKANVDVCASSPNQIFIDRRASPLRKLTNEHEIIAALPDFIPVRLELLSIREQICLFANADIIVAPHGAGLTNIGFSRPGTVVLELMMDSYCNWCYRRLAALSGVHYRCVMGRQSELSSLESIHSSIWTIDQAHFLRELESARALVSVVQSRSPVD